MTPCFNARPFIERTVASVVGQAYPRLDYHVQDGASTDGTAEWLRGQQASWRFESAPDQDQTAALNRGFERTSGEVLAYLNADDLLLPGTLDYVAWYFETHPDVDALYGHRVLIDEHDREIGRWVLPPHDDAVLSWADYVPQETLFWRRGIWQRAGGVFDETYRFAMDWDLLLRFRDAGARFARVPRFLAAFRVHAAQKTSADLTSVGEEEMTRLRSRVHGAPPSRTTISRALRPYLRRHLACHALYRLHLIQY